MIRRRADFSLSPAKTLWLLLAQALVIAPHALRLPIWITLTSIAIAVWRYLASRRQWRAPGRVTRILLLALALAGVLASYGTVFGRDAGVALLVLALSLKLLELTQLRDVMLYLFLGYFLITTSFLYSQSMALAGYMLVVVLILTSALMVVSHPAREARIRPRLRQSASLLLQALPVALLLFLLFPRVSGPLWNLPKDAHHGITGLSDSMSPGSISQLSRSDAVAFRVDFDGEPPANAELYWRGPVLSDYNGETWSAAPPRRLRRSEFHVQPPGVHYTVTLEPHNRLWLFALDVPGSIPSNSYLTQDYQLLARQRVEQRLRYSVTSYLKHTEGARLSRYERRAALQLPAGENPLTRALAQRLRASSGNDAGLVAAVLRMFRQQPFVYTLNPPLLPAHNGADAFLFNTRRGFCEHYASAFVLIMRDAGIPARVVTGYQGGQYNPIGGYLIVRQSDAHAWAEIWLRGRGWVRVDPTAAVAPSRVEIGIEAALPNEAPGGLVFSHNSLLRHVALMWDSLNNGWNQWVLGYDTIRQARLWSQLGLGNASWQWLASALALTVSGALIVLFGYMTLRQRGASRDRVRDAYQRFCRKLGRRGLVRAAQEGPLDYVRRVTRARPELAGRARRITQLYIALRYGPTPNAAQLHKLRSLIRRFRVRRVRR